MRTKYFIILLSHLVFSCSTEVTEIDLGSKTKYSVSPIYNAEKEIVSNDTYDAGEVVKGEIIEAKFEIKNEGDIPLILNKIVPGCGCTNVTDAPNNPLSPGESFIIRADVNTAVLDGKGEIKKSIRLDANVDPYPLVLYITATLN